MTRLISEIAKTLKIELEQLEILEGNYIPQGWIDDDREQRLARRSLLNVLTRRSPIAVQIQQAPLEQDPYPPPPVIDASAARTDG